MISSTWAKKFVMQGLLGSMVAVAGPAFADMAMPVTTPVTAVPAPTTRWYDSIGLSGYMQASGIWNLNGPHSRLNTGRQFDTDSNSFSFNTFLLQIAKPVGDDHYGFTARLRTGQDSTHLPGSGGNNLTVQEGYMTYAATSKLSFIGGKFVTSEGFEGSDTVNNPNFSEGLLYTYAEPITHTGLKANYMISDKANATLGLVNGWDAFNAGAPDLNDGKTILWQLATTPTKQITWSFQGLYGKEYPDPSHSERLSLDTVLGFAATDKLSLNLQGNWGQETNVFQIGGTDVGTSHWDGVGIWASLMSCAKCTESVRFEVLSDQNGAARFGFSNGVDETTGIPFVGNQTVKEFTITHKMMLTSSMGTRLEFRHDWSNNTKFERHEGTLVRNQNTVSMDWFVTF